MVVPCINIRQVGPREVLKTAASGLGFQHLPRDLANVNAWKTMFDPYSAKPSKQIVSILPQKAPRETRWKLAVGFREEEFKDFIHILSLGTRADNPRESEV